MLQSSPMRKNIGWQEQREDGKHQIRVRFEGGEVVCEIADQGRGIAAEDLPKLFEALIEEMADRDLVDIARQRLTLKDTAIEVDIDQI